MSSKSYVSFSHECHPTLLTDVATCLLVSLFWSRRNIKFTDALVVGVVSGSGECCSFTSLPRALLREGQVFLLHGQISGTRNDGTLIHQSKLGKRDERLASPLLTQGREARDDRVRVHHSSTECSVHPAAWVLKDSSFKTDGELIVKESLNFYINMNYTL